MSNYDKIKDTSTCSVCQSPLKRIFVCAPQVALGWDAQAAGNADKYWGKTPLIDMHFDNDDGTHTVIPSEGSDFS